jgi:predicted homoserine dehydrogenase-like protein
MIIVDRALSEREQASNPIKVAMVGAGLDSWVQLALF